MRSSNYVAGNVILLPLIKVGMDYYNILFGYTSYQIYISSAIFISDRNIACIGSCIHTNSCTFIHFALFVAPDHVICLFYIPRVW